MHDHHMRSLGNARTACLRDEAERQRLIHVASLRPDRRRFDALRRLLRWSLHTLPGRPVPSRATR